MTDLAHIRARNTLAAGPSCGSRAVEGGWSLHHERITSYSFPPCHFPALGSAMGLPRFDGQG
jgi:hypothetical protein